MSLRRIGAGPRARVRQTLRDARTNRRHAKADERFLVVRHPRVIDIAYERAFLAWLEKDLPEVRARFELRLLPCRLRDRHVLCLPWLQDPVEDWSQRTYGQACRLAAECDARGIPVVNRVDRLVHAAKADGARRIRTAGLRTPRTVPLDDRTRPLIVREDRGHGRKCRLVDDGRQLDLTGFERPIAVEFVDVRDPEDGLVRKHRYVVAGDVGLPLSMHVCESWRTSGKDHVWRPDLVDEERRFAERAEEHAGRFVRAAKALELDFVAFDYAYDRDGAPVVWEANPYPHIHIATGRGAFRAPAVVRAFAALARLYLRTAGLAVPSRIDDLLDHPAVHAG